MNSRILRRVDLTLLVVMFVSIHSVIGSLVAQLRGVFPCIMCEIQRATFFLLFSFSVSGIFSSDKIRYLFITEVFSGVLIFFSIIHVAILYSIIPDLCEWLISETTHEAGLTFAGCSEKSWEPFGIPTQIGSCVIGISLFVGIHMARKKILRSPFATTKTKN